MQIKQFEKFISILTVHVIMSRSNCLVETLSVSVDVVKFKTLLQNFISILKLFKQFLSYIVNF